MATNRLTELLSSKTTLLADGAIGTNFFNKGLGPGDPPELWNEDEPEKVQALHQEFVDAGSDIILTNTFGANSKRLKLHHAQDRAYNINKRGAEIARKVADSSGRNIVVGGSVGPTGELFVPLGELEFDDAVACFTDQIKGLKAGGADVAWIETMSAQEEMEAAAKAAIACDFPYVVTASFDTAGKTMMGIAPSAMPTLFNNIEKLPLAVGANCGVGASDLLLSVLAMTDENSASNPHNIIVVAKANCGVPKISGDQVIYTGTPELMADYVRLAVDAGARIIGGCCGTSAEHLAAMRMALDQHQIAERPTAEDIIKAIGPIVNPLVIDGVGRVRRNKRRG